MLRQRQTDTHKEGIEDGVHVGRSTAKVDGDRAVEQLGRERVLELAVQVLDDRVKVAQTKEVALLLVLVDVVVRLGQGLQRGLEVLRAHDAARGQLEVLDARRRAAHVHGAVHLGEIERPVRDTDDGDLGLLEQRVQHLERQIGTLLGETDLVEQHDDARVGGAVLVAQRVAEGLLDAFRVGERRALERKDLDRRQVAEGRIGRGLAVEVRGDELHGERLARARLADDEDRHVVENAHEQHEDVLAQGLVERDAVAGVHLLDVEAHLAHENALELALRERDAEVALQLVEARRDAVAVLLARALVEACVVAHGERQHQALLGDRGVARRLAHVVALDERATEPRVQRHTSHDVAQRHHAVLDVAHKVVRARDERRERAHEHVLPILARAVPDRQCLGVLHDRHARQSPHP